jgi:hypothetical protein
VALVRVVRDPALDEIGTVVGNTQDIAARVLEYEGLDLLAGDDDALEATVASDTVIEVDDVVAGSQR